MLFLVDGLSQSSSVVATRLWLSTLQIGRNLQAQSLRTNNACTSSFHLLKVRQLAAAVRQGAWLADLPGRAGRRAAEVIEPGLDRVGRGRHGRRRPQDEHGGVRQAQHQGSELGGIASAYCHTWSEG